MNRKEMCEIFAKFAGREIPLAPAASGYELANPADPVLKEMTDEADRHGVRLCLLWPGRENAEWVTNRVNAHLEQDTDGKWRVSPRFGIG